MTKFNRTLKTIAKTMPTTIAKTSDVATTERARLAAELSDYRSDADRNDLNALLDEFPDTDTEQIRDLLNRRTFATV